jgi:hypothetical protein
VVRDGGTTGVESAPGGRCIIMTVDRRDSVTFCRDLD